MPHTGTTQAMNQARSAYTMANGDERAILVVLLADGDIVIPGLALTVADSWRAVGCTVQDGERVCFVQAQIGGEPWSALVPESVLAATSAPSRSDCGVRRRHASAGPCSWRCSIDSGLSFLSRGASPVAPDDRRLGTILKTKLRMCWSGAFDGLPLLYAQIGVRIVPRRQPNGAPCALALANATSVPRSLGLNAPPPAPDHAGA
jgi:hypothetical protein